MWFIGQVDLIQIHKIIDWSIYFLNPAAILTNKIEMKVSVSILFKLLN
jgi:hypothetical protein